MAKEGAVQSGRVGRVALVYEACCLRCSERTHVIAGSVSECESKLKPRGWRKAEGFWWCPVCGGGEAKGDRLKLHRGEEAKEGGA